MMEDILVKEYGTPCGDLLLGDCGGRLCLCSWRVGRKFEAVNAAVCKWLSSKIVEADSELLSAASKWLDCYFAGFCPDFELPLLIVGTDFQKSVRAELQKIGYGCTASYAYVAQRIDKKGYVRAVANACSSNPLSIFVPCHRVVGSNGSLTGYEGGIAAKAFLLNLEAEFCLFNKKNIILP